MVKIKKQSESQFSNDLVNKITEIGYYEFTPNLEYSIPEIGFWSLCFVEYGEINLTSSKHSFKVTQGQCFLASPSKDFLFYTGSVAVNMIIISFYSEATLFKRFAGHPFFLSNVHRNLFAHILHEARNAYTEITPNVFNISEFNTKNVPLGSEELVYLYLSELLILLTRSYSKISEKSEQQFINSYFGKKSIDIIIAMMEENLDKNISISEFAEHFHVSPSYLKKNFKLETGYSLITYYRMLKIKKAKLWIREDNLNFTEISERLGYDTIHHFSNTFKKNTGLSPTAYKNSIQAIENKLED